MRRGDLGVGKGRLAVAPRLLLAASLLVVLPAAQAGPGPDADPEGASAAGDEAVRLGRRARDRDRPVDWYNYGTALLRQGRPDAAAEALRRSLEAERPEVRHAGRYNMGLAEANSALRAEDPGIRRQRLLAAREAFREALRDEPADAEARWNLELVQAWLERESRRGGGGGGGSGGGSRGDAGEGAGELGPEEAEALLDAAGRAESDVRDRLLRRTRFRDPVVERNW